MASATRRISLWPCVSVVLSLTFVLLPSTCLAQDNFGLDSGSPIVSSTSANHSSSTSSAAVQTHTISVGLADHKFRPESTNANVGDTIEFAFYPLNHSVVRAEYGKKSPCFPCIPYEMTGQGKAGFFSGFKPVDSVLDSPPTYSIEIENTDPIFFYCSAVGSCINYGMVGVINPNMTTSVDRQHQLALDSSYMLNPGEPFPPEAPQSSSIPTSSATPGLSDGTSNDKKGLSTGAIAGIAIAGSSVVIIAALLFFFWGRTKSLKDAVDRNAGIVRRRGPNNRTSPAMLEIGHNHPTTINGNGIGGVYHQYQQTPLLSPPIIDSAYQQYNYNQCSNAPGYSTPAPSYFHPQTPPPHPPPPPPPPPPPSQQELEQQQNAYKYNINSPVGHPAHTAPPLQQQPPLGIHHALSQHSLGAAFELSPTGDATRTLQNNHSSPPHTCHNANANASVNGSDITSPSPSHPHRIASPSHVLAAATAAATTTTTTTDKAEEIPSYYETVYRPSPKHINGGGIGPTEIDGRAVTEEITPARAIEAKWEEVGEKTVGGGGVIYRG